MSDELFNSNNVRISNCEIIIYSNYINFEQMSHRDYYLKSLFKYLYLWLIILKFINTYIISLDCDI